MLQYMFSLIFLFVFPPAFPPDGTNSGATITGESQERIEKLSYLVNRLSQWGVFTTMGPTLPTFARKRSNVASVGNWRANGCTTRLTAFPAFNALLVQHTGIQPGIDSGIEDLRWDKGLYHHSKGEVLNG